MNMRLAIVVFLLVLVLPLLLFEIPVILGMIPKKVQKFMCFVPGGIVGFFTLKMLLEGNIGLFVIFLFFFGITLYGGFAMQDIISSKN